MTGLSVDTLRAWERRYTVVKPTRSARGRSYDDADVKRLISIRNVLNNGYSIGAVAGLPDQQLEELLNLPHDSGPVAEPEDPAPTAGIESVVAALEAFDSPRVNDELGRMAAMLGPAGFVHRVAMPLMRLVGDRWHAGTLQVAQEHLATESVRSLLGAMLRLNNPGDAQPQLLTATPAGEIHELGVLAAAVLAGARGFQVTCLGPNLPASDILFAVGQCSPEIVLMGLATPEPLPAAIETVRTVAAGLPPGTELWLGGSGARVAMPEEDRAAVVLLADLRAFETMLVRFQSRAARGAA
jgi:DNA-binding transcriptional MerR regulator